MSKAMQFFKRFGVAIRDEYFKAGVALGVAIQSGAAFATTSGSLPWDSPIKTLTNDLTGPVATGISVVAFLAAGAALVFGEELGGIAKKALYVVMGVAMIVFGSGFMSDLGITGAMV
ncbi:TrbC/VirB2 family protein [Acidithiobacillus caldus]|uniref:TrbC/VirB2 family protein n=1 Tax=Acidithiobacillus caldus TaxID=33059 RepID=UPI001C079B4A|nr:TrbC/VirB2 family protein [Acidithiobacillus caldus]MBU2770118.1 conjugal transfer protein TrbC [Acidithiobacillus caldus]